VHFRPALNPALTMGVVNAESSPDAQVHKTFTVLETTTSGILILDTTNPKFLHRQMRHPPDRTLDRPNVQNVHDFCCNQERHLDFTC